MYLFIYSLQLSWAVILKTWLCLYQSCNDKSINQSSGRKIMFSNIPQFQPIICEDLLLFVYVIVNWKSLDFGWNRQFPVITFGCGKNCGGHFSLFSGILLTKQLIDTIIYSCSPGSYVMCIKLDLNRANPSSKVFVNRWKTSYAQKCNIWPDWLHIGPVALSLNESIALLQYTQCINSIYVYIYHDMIVYSVTQQYITCTFSMRLLHSQIRLFRLLSSLLIVLVGSWYVVRHTTWLHK